MKQAVICFTDLSAYNLEKFINSQLKTLRENEEVFRLIDIKFSSAGSNSGVWFSALIIYEYE